MYDLIFAFFLKFCKKIETVDPEDNATSLLLVVVFSHLFFVIASIQYFFNFNSLTFVFGSGHSKYLWLPVILLVMTVIYRIYKGKGERITEKYKEVDLLSVGYTILMTVIAVAPFTVGVLLLRK